MLSYLVILLDRTSVSFCHYPVTEAESKPISLDNLKAGILFAMKENLMIQFVYPSYTLPKEYKQLIESIDHVKIMPYNSPDIDLADIVVYDDVDTMHTAHLFNSVSYVLRTTIHTFVSHENEIYDILGNSIRLNVMFTDIETVSDVTLNSYRDCLSRMSSKVEGMYVNGKNPQLNLLTDRMMLQSMNNCNAGDSTITLAPDGKFYLCPAFVYESQTAEQWGLGGPKDAPFSIGSLVDGLDIKNAQLYKLDHAPICRVCDAYQCKRCIWLNRRMTMEVNTPSHEQCVIAHLERNESRKLLYLLREHGQFLPEQEISEIDYLDPFDKVIAE
ncbi:MAG: CXXX repeat peptide maturase [Parabacteroides sp.]|nr:CXXX repeat peptide maturase [Parabacteroides sp.]